MKPYYTDDSVTLWHGDMRELIPTLELTADAIVTDPPYGETSLTWDRWPDGWPAVAAIAASRSTTTANMYTSPTHIPARSTKCPT